MQTSPALATHTVQVKLIRAYGAQATAQPEVLVFNTTAPRELVCRAVLLKYLISGVAFEAVTAEDYSFVVVTLLQPLELGHLAKYDARAKECWQDFDKSYEDLKAAGLQDADGKKYLDAISIMLSLNSRPFLFPHMRPTSNYYDGALVIHSTN